MGTIRELVSQYYIGLREMLVGVDVKNWMEVAHDTDNKQTLVKKQY